MFADHHVIQRVHRVHAHQYRLRRGDIALDHDNVLDMIDNVLIGDQTPGLADLAGKQSFLDALDEFFGGAAMRDEIGDGAELEVVALGEGDEVGQAGHCAVIVHDLADHAGGGEAGKACDIDGRFGMAGADQSAAVTRDERKHVPRRDNVVAAHFGVDRDRDRPGAVRRRDAGCDTFSCFDGHCEGGFVPRAVGLAHQRNAQPLAPGTGHGQANQPAGMLGHEVDGVRRGELRRDDEVTFILAVLIIDEDEHAPGPRLLDDFRGRRDIVLQAG